MFFDKIQVEILKNAVKRDLSIGKEGDCLCQVNTYI